jgi:hypothetical protein
MGSVRQMDENTVEVQEDFSLVCFDIVSNPSTIGAYITENTAVKSRPYTAVDNINKLIHDFLSEIK